MLQATTSAQHTVLQGGGGSAVSHQQDGGVVALGRAAQAPQSAPACMHTCACTQACALTWGCAGQVKRVHLLLRMRRKLGVAAPQVRH